MRQTWDKERARETSRQEAKVNKATIGLKCECGSDLEIFISDHDLSGNMGLTLKPCAGCGKRIDSRTSDAIRKEKEEAYEEGKEDGAEEAERDSDESYDIDKKEGFELGKEAGIKETREKFLGNALPGLTEVSE